MDVYLCFLSLILSLVDELLLPKEVKDMTAEDEVDEDLKSS